MTKTSVMNTIDIVPGVMPSTDATASDVPCWTDSLHVRFDPTTGRLRKLGGWMANSFDYGYQISGTIRTIYSAVINQKTYTIIGTNSYLYALIGSSLTNISPLQTTPVTVANSLATHYGTLTTDPLHTATGSNTVVVSDPDAGRYMVNDTYTLSGATTTNGIPNTELNAPHVIRALGSGTVSFRTATAATSNGIGGGASVVRSDGLINVTKTAHGLNNGDRVGISGAANTGGITAPQINMEFVIRNVATNSFDVMTAGTSTSAVTASGGSGTEYFPQLAAGNLNQGVGQGYGAGLYGVGLYGTALVSSSGETYPRIWFCDRYGDNIILTDGNVSGVYTWDGDTTMAPTLVPNAPTDINYAFVSDNILVTVGHGFENEIFSSDQGDYTQWTASSTNQVFQDVIQGAGRFISHVPADGYNLLFTEQQTYTMKYVGSPSVYQILLLDPQIGIIAPMARCSVNGIDYWMGPNNFYQFRGGKVEVMPCNFATESTILRYVFDDLNYSQRYKIFAWYNEIFDEIWWHYPSQESNECDSVARFSRKLTCWMPDVLSRSAGEYPQMSLSNPRLGNVGTLYTHESGSNDNTSAMVWSARTKKYVSGKDTVVQTQMIPDSNQTGNISLEVRTFNYAQSVTAVNDKTYTVSPTTEKVPVQLNGRYYDYTFSGSDLNQTFLMGQWYEQPQPGATAP